MTSKVTNKVTAVDFAVHTCFAAISLNACKCA